MTVVICSGRAPLSHQRPRPRLVRRDHRLGRRDVLRTRHPSAWSRIRHPDLRRGRRLPAAGRSHARHHHGRPRAGRLRRRSSRSARRVRPEHRGDDLASAPRAGLIRPRRPERHRPGRQGRHRPGLGRRGAPRASRLLDGSTRRLPTAEPSGTGRRGSVIHRSAITHRCVATESRGGAGAIPPTDYYASMRSDPSAGGRCCRPTITHRCVIADSREHSLLDEPTPTPALRRRGAPAGAPARRRGRRSSAPRPAPRAPRSRAASSSRTPPPAPAARGSPARRDAAAPCRSAP